MPYIPIYSLTDIRHLLVVGETREDHWLDFKSELGNDNRENARDIAQFANASGGTLVIGAQESAQTLSGFINIPDPPKVISRIEGIVKGHLTPVPVIEPESFEVARGVHIVVVNVPPSLALVARHDRHESYEFVIRGYESKRFMTLLEVEAQMENKERAMRLRLERIPPDAPVGLDAYVRVIGHNDWRVTGVDDDVVRLSKDDAEMVAPLAYVEAVYEAGEPEATWVIRLPCYIALHKHTKRLHLNRALPHGSDQSTFHARGLD
jgi:hypothetical protein